MRFDLNVPQTQWGRERERNGRLRSAWCSSISVEGKSPLSVSTHRKALFVFIATATRTFFLRPNRARKKRPADRYTIQGHFVYATSFIKVLYVSCAALYGRAHTCFMHINTSKQQQQQQYHARAFFFPFVCCVCVCVLRWDDVGFMSLASLAAALASPCLKWNYDNIWADVACIIRRWYGISRSIQTGFF